MSLGSRILHCYYKQVLTLKEFTLRVCDVAVTLEHEDDPDRYRSLLESSLVGLETIDMFPRQRFKPSEVISEMIEVIDRVQAKLFDRAKGRPRNILTMGYTRADHRGEFGRANLSRPGISNFFPNTNITALQALEWKILLSRIGEDALYYLLLETSIFLPLPNDSFCQLTGSPIFELTEHTPLTFTLPDQKGTKRPLEVSSEEADLSKRRKLNNGTNFRITPLSAVPLRRRAADIAFNRYRIFYGRPVMGRDSHDGNRTILVGLPPDHVLNRLAPIPLTSASKIPSKENILGRDTRHVLKHIFPRQFGLRSGFEVYSSPPGSADIDLNDEISSKGNIKTPKRLKSALHLVEELIQRHWTCNYRIIRSRACPSKVKKAQLKKREPLDSSVILEIMSETYNSQNDHDLLDESSSSLIIQRNIALAKNETIAKPRFVEFTCSYYEVYNYVRNVTLVVIPFDLWGCKKNFNNIMKCVKLFIKGHRLETFTLHTVMQNFSTQECEWLLPLNTRALHQRPSVTDALKRRELIEEFLYWYFDSFVIPLIKTAFYATDSGALRQRIIYFRLDDWTTLCRPLLLNLTNGVFQKIDASAAEAMLRYKKLGFSFVRLLPKETGVRPIVNLRRKVKKLHDFIPLSINQILQTTFQILTYERINQPDLIGAAVFGRNEIYAKLKQFKSRLLSRYQHIPKLYFVKLDVKACFDTIDQAKLIQILMKLLTEESYMIHKSARITPIAGKTRRIFMKKALPDSQHPHFISYATKLASMLKHTIIVDQVVYSYEEKREIVELLKEHITENLIKIGSNYFRQVVGIPQGSVLSTLLCAFFYGDLEQQKYQFTNNPDCLLCRLVDDYLFITTDLEKAEQFLRTMSQGHPDYGCFIAPEKTLINFHSRHFTMNRIPSEQQYFPWCGLLIDMENLSVRGDYSRYSGRTCAMTIHDESGYNSILPFLAIDLGDTLTVDRRRHPWTAFQNKMLQMARLKSHALFWDAALNDSAVIYRNVYENFLLGAMKMSAYLTAWKIDVSNKDTIRFLANIILKTIRYTYKLMTSKASGVVARENDAVCNISEKSTTWLGLCAFKRVLEQRRSIYFRTLIGLLDREARHRKYAHLLRDWEGMMKEADELLEWLQY